MAGGRGWMGVWLWRTFCLRAANVPAAQAGRNTSLGHVSKQPRATPWQVHRSRRHANDRRRSVRDGACRPRPVLRPVRMGLAWLMFGDASETAVGVGSPRGPVCAALWEGQSSIVDRR